MPQQGLALGRGRVLSTQQDGAFGAELVHEQCWVWWDPSSPAISQPRRGWCLGQSRPHPTHLLPPAPDSAFLKTII